MHSTLSFTLEFITKQNCRWGIYYHEIWCQLNFIKQKLNYWHVFDSLGGLQSIMVLIQLQSLHLNIAQV